MKTPASTAPLLVPLLLLAGCGSAPEPREEATAGPAAVPLPPSALAAAVRALETLDAVRPEGALTQLRALQCDSLIQRPSGAEIVRVLLDLTVYAATAGEARESFDEVRLALEAEARSDGDAGPASAERVERVMGDLDWDRPGREDLVSFSDVIRLEIQPGRGAVEPVEAGSAGGPQLTSSLESYVRRSASHGIGQVDLAYTQRQPAPGVSDHRLRIVPVDVSARYSRAEIGRFLSALDSGSPAVRVTRLEVERSQHEPDVHAARGWTFEAELCVRVLEERVEQVVPLGE